MGESSYLNYNCSMYFLTHKASTPRIGQYTLIAMVLYSSQTPQNFPLIHVGTAAHVKECYFILFWSCPKVKKRSDKHFLLFKLLNLMTKDDPAFFFLRMNSMDPSKVGKIVKINMSNQCGYNVKEGHRYLGPPA